jgi:hypothetical protein
MIGGIGQYGFENTGNGLVNFILNTDGHFFLI